ncbi:polysaccharide deacetylase family protein [Antarcticibacterium arcticum]|uniref:Polysaccharide deacetylase family protein n=1 Tax=Antarcticibacterium arcticum TaxID=2585771 RepID=A0A5B8YF36_9FLAO|nr:polysaccharide deacetylase family protein [Antarcticibacterium arcticum]QED36530.1 polysaccharide deacetylase family protein [Antarcticibacterium arcticum]
MNQREGGLVISLDFELLWGVFDQINWEVQEDYFLNTRKVIPQVLDIFKNFNIHATWATVGMLFNKNWNEWERNKPANLPEYSNSGLSAYQFGSGIHSKGTEDMCFAPQLISKIAITPGQEIATHTYSHYYCLEPGQQAVQFKEDLLKAIELAKKINISLQSLVFPRNQLKKEYLEICFELGILNVRSNPQSWYWKDAKSNNIVTKISRTGDAYLDLGKKSYPWEEVIKIPGLPTLQMASRFLRPVEENNVLRALKLKRILKEMETAAGKKEIYHLWWHPHNFGNNPEESMKDLEIILEQFVLLRNKFGFQSLNMAEVGEQ